MKFVCAIAVVGMMILLAGSTFGKVKVNVTALQWEDVASLEGDELFNNLCAACHGTGGKGDGLAAGALGKGVPDLTMLSSDNGGVYSHKKVENVIYGKHRAVEKGTINMPLWGEQFMYVRPGPTFPRKYYARERVHALSTYIETLQVN